MATQPNPTKKPKLPIKRRKFLAADTLKPTERAGEGPSHTVYPCAKQGATNPNLLGPLRERLGLPIERNQPIGSFVPALLSTGGPSAVFGRVRSVVVDTVDAVRGGWPETNVRHEVLEGTCPARTDVDPSASIVLVGGMGWVGTAINHRAPRAILWLARGAEGQHLRQVRADRLQVEAATRASLAAAEMGPSHDSAIAAGTRAKPVALIVSASGLRDNDQSSEGLPLKAHASSRRSSHVL